MQEDMNDPQGAVPGPLDALRQTPLGKVADDQRELTAHLRARLLEQADEERIGYTPFGSAI